MKLVEALSLFNPKNKPKSLLAISACAFPDHMSEASIVIVIQLVKFLFVVCSYVTQDNQRQENSLPGSRVFKL